MSQFIGGPTRHWETVTPHDTNAVFTKNDGSDDLFQSFYTVGTAGNVVITKVDGTDDTVPVIANSYHPLMGKVIKSTGTTATPIFAARI